MTPAETMSQFRRLYPDPATAARCMVLDGVLHLSEADAIAVIVEAIHRSFPPDAARRIAEGIKVC